MNAIRLLAAGALAALVAGCGAGSSKLALGQPCTADEECRDRHGLTASGTCSASCEDDSSCPTAENWSCQPPAEDGTRTCNCAFDAETACDIEDGLDNDCDGTVDNGGRCVELTRALPSASNAVDLLF